MTRKQTELQKQQRHAARAVDKRIKQLSGDRTKDRRAGKVRASDSPPANVKAHSARSRNARPRENQKRIAKMKREHRATLTERVDAFEYVLRRLEGAVLRIEKSVERQAVGIAHEISKVHAMVPTVADVAALATTKAVDRLIQRGARS